MSGPLIRFEGVTKRFGLVTAVDAVELEIAEGEFFALLGPSGCGKTTLLRMLAGFEAPDAGRILIDGADVAAEPPNRRPVNMVFQSYALFPHMSVEANVGYGLRMERVAAAERRARVEEALALVRLQGYGDRRPDQLSGGQRQRVALARALVKRPRVLLLDEPLSALDAKLRQEMRLELAQLQARVGLTFLMVTHDQQEALSLASRCAVMDAGRLAQIGAPAELYDRPQTRFVAGFIGEVNLIEVEAGGRAPGLGCALAVEPMPAGAFTAALRPERIVLTRGGPTVGANAVAGLVRRANYLGADTLYEVECRGGALLRALRPNAEPDRLAVGDAVVALWPGDALSVLSS